MYTSYNIVLFDNPTTLFLLSISPAVLPLIIYHSTDIYLQYHKDRGNHRVVGVLVYPRSTASEKGEAHCFNDVQVRLSEKSTNEVFYSYSVQWIESDIPWALRWDNYL